ncbi:hypothetical protein D3C71_1717000 [compost metagenome]
MVDEDIKNNVDKYIYIDIPDSNIDFRRVRNLKIFFERNYKIMTNNPYEISEWMPGDIVVFGTTHIGIVSDKRNGQGIPYIIHNSGQPNRDEDILIRLYKFRGISGHYRL